MAVEDSRNSGPLEADITDDRVSSSREDIVTVSVNYSTPCSVTECSAIQILKRLSHPIFSSFFNLPETTTHYELTFHSHSMDSPLLCYIYYIFLRLNVVLLENKRETVRTCSLLSNHQCLPSLFLPMIWCTRKDKNSSMGFCSLHTSCPQPFLAVPLKEKGIPK